MKKKITLIALMLLLVTSLMVLFAFSVSADDGITVTYNWYGGSAWETAKPNEDGSYTLRANKKSGDGTATLSDGTVVAKEFYGWFDREGNLYAPGETVVFTKSTCLYEAYGVTVNSEADLRQFNGWKDNTYVKLGADLTIDSTLGTEWCTRLIDLNGHNITFTTKEAAFSVKRGAIILIGEGKILHQPQSPHTSLDKGFIWFDGHGYGDGDNPQLCWIGKDVTVETPYALLYENGRGADNLPKMAISGKVTARALARFNVTLVNATCYIADSAVINVTSNLFEYKNTSGTTKYLTVTLDGTINVANGTSDIFIDFALEKVDFVIAGGKFCITENDSKNIAYYLPDTLMLKKTVENELTWYEIISSDCVHNWIKNDEKSVAATLEQLGLDVFCCENCGREKSVITAYDPSNTEITITVTNEYGEKQSVKVLAGDVLALDIAGVGANTKFTLVGIKGTDLYPDSIITAIEVPVGVSAITITNTNEALETINIIDGVKLAITSLAGFKNIKTINIGSADVTINSIGNNTSLESVISNKAGATILFNSKCFDGKANVKFLTMVAGSTYKFGTNSFQRTGVESVIFPDGATVEFVGDAAFYNASTKFVYIGDCVTDDKLYKKPFDCAEYLEVVIIKNLTYIDQYCFCVAGANNAKAQIKVYCHSENISINNNAFINRQNYGVEFYTIDPDIKSLNCKYTVYNGIAHPYTSKTITESTCVTQGTFGYATDCSCGNDYRTNTYVTYSNIDAELNEVEHEAYGTEIGYLPLKEEHTVSDIVCNIDFVNGMTEMGIKCYKCLYCDEISTKEETASFPAIFKTIGYSYAEAEGVYGIMQSFGVNHKALSEYESVIGQKLSYGLAAGSVNKLGENADLVKADGTAYDGAICASYVDKAFDLIEMKISGLTEAHKGTELYICAYYIVNGKVYYISGGVSNLEKPTTISYNKIVNA